MSDGEGVRHTPRGREVSASQLVEAPAEAIWPDLVEPGRFAEWFAFCDAVEEPAEGIRVLLGSWGSRRSAVTTELTAVEPHHRLAWRHLEERLDDRPAPRMSLDTHVELRLEEVEGGTMVTATSRQVPRDRLQAVVLRLVGRRQVRAMLESSLTLLAARHR